MSKTIAILAPGAMGSAVARRLSENGARVLTSLKGRSEATLKRAADAGMVGTEDDALAEATSSSRSCLRAKQWRWLNGWPR